MRYTKAILILSSLLSACGGNGSTFSNIDTTLPSNNIGSSLPVLKEVSESNRQITSLQSRVQLLNQKPSTVRASTINGIKYADISDVDLISYDEGAVIKGNFETDVNGKITGFAINNDNDDKIVLKRDGENDKFSYEGSEGSHMMYQEGKFVSKGKEIKLTYSDFGIWDMSNIEYGWNGNDNVPTKESEGAEKESFTVGMFGGYKEREISANNIVEDMTFTGKAVGYVNGRNYDINNNEKSTISLDGDAKLVFDTADKKSTLTLDFNNWYTVNAMTQNGKTDLTFTNEDKVKDEVLKLKETAKNDIASRDNSNYSLSYYFDANTNKVVEAVGGLGFIEMNDDDRARFNDKMDQGDYYVLFNSAFGLKRD